MGHPREQGLIVETPEGPVLITGCAHPGVVRMVEAAQKITTRNLHLIMGGFHMVRASEAQIRNTIDQLVALGVERVAPSHCSGDLARTLFQEVFGENLILTGVGTKIVIGDE
jgi:7,8-dihydropterin-6-yl-methyl-4-(beta-D-ribofuranosyl)aminobenzene 5'-phosphate synthase